MIVLKIKGALCPGCGGEAHTTERYELVFTWWIGHARPIYCPDCCEKYYMLFSESRRFCGLVRVENSLMAAGTIRYPWEFPPHGRDVDEIPF